MDTALPKPSSCAAQDREIIAAVRRERGRLLSFILRTVRDAADAEDVLQEALYELVTAFRLRRPVEHTGAWLKRVARNRIIDRFRSGTPQIAAADPEDEQGAETLLPSAEDGPEAALLRELMMRELELALEELPQEQREVFIAHEIEGASFKELSARWGVGVNTLLSRKRYAVLRLRARLQDAYEDWVQS